MSVLQALNCKNLWYKAREQPNSSAYDVATNRIVNMYEFDSLTTEFESLTETDKRAMGDFDQQGISSASTVVEDQDALDFGNLPKDVYGTLDAFWGYLDMNVPPHNVHLSDDLSFATAQPTRVSMIDPVQNDLQDPATTHIPPVQGSRSLFNLAMTSPKYLASNSILNEVDMSSNTNVGNDTTGPSQSADISPERPVKRQRLKSLPSSKKKRLATNGHARNERSEIFQKVPAVTNTTHNNQAVTTVPTVPILSYSKSLDKEISLQIIPTDRVAEWDRRRSRTTDLNDALVVKDVNISNSDRRPLSWPRRNVIRKSLDLSVEALRSKLKNYQVAN